MWSYPLIKSNGRIYKPRFLKLLSFYALLASYPLINFHHEFLTRLLPRGSFTQNHFFEPLRVELFSFTLTRYTSPALPALIIFLLQYGVDFHHFLLIQQITIWRNSLFPRRPFSCYRIGSKQALQLTAPDISGQATFIAPRHVFIICVIVGNLSLAIIKGTPKLGRSIIPLRFFSLVFGLSVSLYKNNLIMYLLKILTL